MEKKTYDFEALRELAPSLRRMEDGEMLAALELAEEMKREERLARQREGIRRRAASGMRWGRMPVGFRANAETGKLETDPSKEFALKLAFALHATGKLSVREISAEVAKYGLVGADGESLLPGTMWRMLSGLHNRQK